MGSYVIFDNPYLDRCLRFGWYLDIIMLLLMGDTFLMFGPSLVVDMDDWDCTFDDGWSDVVWFFDLPYIWCDTRAYFRFSWDLYTSIDLHDHTHLRDTHRDDDLIVILSWSPMESPFCGLRILLDAFLLDDETHFFICLVKIWFFRKIFGVAT